MEELYLVLYTDTEAGSISGYDLGDPPEFVAAPGDRYLNTAAVADEFINGQRAQFPTCTYRKITVGEMMQEGK